MEKLDLDPKTQKPPKPEISEQERTIRFVGKIIAFVVLMIFLMVTSCTMHSNTFDAARLVEEAKIKAIENGKMKLENEKSLTFQETKRQRTAAMKELIENGKNPVAVRCAFAANQSRDEKDSCARIGLLIGSGNRVDQQ